MVSKWLATLATRYHWMVFVLIAVLVIDCALMTTHSGTFYEETYRLKTKTLKGKLSYIIPHKYFHACSINCNCNYVVEDKKNQINVYNKRTEIPGEENLIAIWMKMTRSYQYKINMETRSWHDARKACQLQGGDLASVLNKKEEETIKELLPYSKKIVWFWYGLNDIETEDVFVWSDGSKYTYKNWVGIEPNNAGSGGEDCMMSTRSMEWYDASCRNKEYFVCKIPVH